MVINTRPLIALAAADALEIAGRLPLQLICPAEVPQELDAGAARGFPRIEPAWLTVVPLLPVDGDATSATSTCSTSSASPP